MGLLENIQGLVDWGKENKELVPGGFKENDLSDGYHTFGELYEFRKLYNALLFNEWSRLGKYEVHKSWKHFDGEDCFGGGWFIVVAMLPMGQISNHYKAGDWDLFNVEVSERAKFEFDGHTPGDVMDRMRDTILLENDHYNNLK